MSVRALGFSSSSFNPTHPGRLCRGRERWIQAWDEDEVPGLHRLVLSGAEFSDDSARDAVRGLNRSGIDIAALLKALFKGKTLVAFREEGGLTEVPESVEDEEQTFLAPRRGGAWFDPCQRWRMVVEDVDDLAARIIRDEVDGVLVLPKGAELDQDLDDAIYLMTGMGDSSAFPVRRFQPLGVVAVLDKAEALVAVHLDKHGPALGIYTREPWDKSELLRAMADDMGILAVPFAIPPMLARWDRALQELRVWWMQNRDGEFPVPPAEEPTRWSRMSRKKRGAAAEE